MFSGLYKNIILNCFCRRTSKTQTLYFCLLYSLEVGSSKTSRELSSLATHRLWSFQLARLQGLMALASQILSSLIRLGQHASPCARACSAASSAATRNRCRWSSALCPLRRGGGWEPRSGRRFRKDPTVRRNIDETHGRRHRFEPPLQDPKKIRGHRRQKKHGG